MNSTEDNTKEPMTLREHKSWNGTKGFGEQKHSNRAKAAKKMEPSTIIKMIPGDHLLADDPAMEKGSRNSGKPAPTRITPTAAETSVDILGGVCNQDGLTIEFDSVIPKGFQPTVATLGRGLQNPKSPCLPHV